MLTPTEDKSQFVIHCTNDEYKMAKHIKTDLFNVDFKDKFVKCMDTTLYKHKQTSISTED